VCPLKSCSNYARPVGGSVNLSQSSKEREEESDVFFFFFGPLVADGGGSVGRSDTAYTCSIAHSSTNTTLMGDQNVCLCNHSVTTSSRLF